MKNRTVNFFEAMEALNQGKEIYSPGVNASYIKEAGEVVNSVTRKKANFSYMEISGEWEILDLSKSWLDKQPLYTCGHKCEQGAKDLALSLATKTLVQISKARKNHVLINKTDYARGIIDGLDKASKILEELIGDK